MERRLGSTIWTTTARFERATSEEIERHVPLLRKILDARYYGSDLSYEEKWAIGLTGIAFAIERFDPSRGAGYAYWIAYQIDKALKNEARRLAAQRRVCALFAENAEIEPIDENEWNERLDRERREELAVDVQLLRAAIDDLDERPRRVVKRLAFDGAAQNEVAAEEGVTQSCVSKIYRAALEKMKRSVERARFERQNRS